MRFTRFLAQLALVCLIVLSASPVRADEAASKSLQAFVDDLVPKRMSACGVPGVAIAVVWADPELHVLARGYGFANVEQRVPVVAERTRFGIASVTKAITATAVMQLVERGRLDLHSDIDRYLPFRLDRGSSSEPITLAHLLTHTSGLEERNIGAGAARADEVMPLHDYLLAHPPVRVARPGEVWSYANLNYSLAGYLVELGSGMPFTTYVRQNVLEPLGMQRTTFAIGDDDKDVALLYEQVDGHPQARPFPFLHDVPAGGLYSTAADMARFIGAHLRDGRTGDGEDDAGHGVLREATAREMHARHYAFDPSLAGMAYGFMEDLHDGRRALVHEGWMGYSSLLTLIPELGIGMFVTTNGGSESCDFTSAVSRATVDRLAPVGPRKQPQVPTSPTAPSRRLEGTYRTTRHSSSTIEKLFVFLGLAREADVRVAGDGTLLAGKGRFVAASPMLFERIDKEGRIAFREGASGEIDVMSNGTETYRRISWTESLLLHRSVLAFSILVFLGTLAAWPVAALARRVRRVRGPVTRSESSAAQRFARWLPRVVAGLGVLFLAGLVAPFFGLYGAYWLFFGVPTLVKAVLVVPFVMMFAIALLPFAALRARTASVHCAVTFLAGVGLLWLLDQYNLIGFHY